MPAARRRSAAGTAPRPSMTERPSSRSLAVARQRPQAWWRKPRGWRCIRRRRTTRPRSWWPSGSWRTSSAAAGSSATGRRDDDGRRWLLPVHSAGSARVRRAAGLRVTRRWAPAHAAKPACRWSLQRPVPVTLPVRARPERRTTTATTGPGRKQRATLYRAECQSNHRGHPKPVRAFVPAAQPGPPPVLDLPRHEVDGERWAAAAVAVPDRLNEGGHVVVDPKGRGLAAEGAVRWSDAGEPIFGQHVSYPSDGRADPSAASGLLPGSGTGTSPPSPARPGRPVSPSFLRCRCVQPGAPLPAARVLRCAAPFQARRRWPAAGRSPSAAKGAARHQE